MKRIIIPIIATLLPLSIQAAEYQARYKIQDVTGLQPFNPAEKWVGISPSYTTWLNDGVITSCSNWSPSESTITINQSFTQTATDCLQPQKRSRQDREQDTYSKVIKNIGPVVIEFQNLTVSSTRSSIGTKESWVATTPTYTTWTNSGSVTNCTNWSPETSTVTYNQSFTQTTSNCEQPQTRFKQEREQETTTNAIRNVGNQVTEFQNIPASSTRTAIGTKESWSASTPSYTAWTSSGNTVCTWTPDVSTVYQGRKFTQTGSCTETQTRTKQNREQEVNTGTYRNIGAPITESQSSSYSAGSRQAYGTKFCDRVCQGGG